MKYQTEDAKVAAGTEARERITQIIAELSKAEDGKDADLGFLTREGVGKFCTALGIKRNWAELTLPEIAPDQPEGVQCVPEDETVAVLTALKLVIGNNLVEPSADGKPSPHLINDFLPEGTQFKGQKCLGHLWEMRYALAVELEHGTTRGTNVTNNHPLLTGLVVLAHLAEDSLYYARLWEMETEGEMLNGQIEGADQATQLTTLQHLCLARKHKQARISQKLGLDQTTNG